MGIGDVEPGSAEYLDANVPDLPVSTDGQAEYFVETDDPALLEDGRIFAPMDALQEAPSFAWRTESVAVNSHPIVVLMVSQLYQLGNIV